MKYATAICPERTKETGRVQNPSSINSPPKNSRMPATPIVEKGQKGPGPWPPPGNPNNFWVPCCIKRSAATMRRTLSSWGDHREQNKHGLIIEMACEAALTLRNHRRIGKRFIIPGFNYRRPERLCLLGQTPPGPSSVGRAREKRSAWADFLTDWCLDHRPTKLLPLPLRQREGSATGNGGWERGSAGLHKRVT